MRRVRDATADILDRTTLADLLKQCGQPHGTFKF
jgi:hypothetical protein